MATYNVQVIRSYELNEAQEVVMDVLQRIQTHNCGVNGYIAAIKYLRLEFKLGLLEAKTLADHIFGRS